MFFPNKSQFWLKANKNHDGYLEKYKPDKKKFVDNISEDVIKDAKENDAKQKANEANLFQRVLEDGTEVKEAPTGEQRMQMRMCKPTDFLQQKFSRDQDLDIDLICEECEVETAVVKCEECDEVFCPKCAELCHQRLDLGVTLHPHELQRRIRPVNSDDTSKIIRNTKIFPPSYELYEEELQKRLDLSKPNTLVTDNSSSNNNNLQTQDMNDNTTNNSIVINEEEFPYMRQLSAFKAGEIVIFINPINQMESYGTILSEWDFRHGKVAPTLLRGDVSGTWYMVEINGIMNGNLDAHEQINNYIHQFYHNTNVISGDNNDNDDSIIGSSNNTKNDSLPVLQDIGDIPLRKEREISRKIDERVMAIQRNLIIGPLNHFNPSVLDHQNNNNNNNNNDLHNEYQEFKNITVIDDNNDKIHQNESSVEEALNQYSENYLGSVVLQEIKENQIVPASKRRLSFALGSVNESNLQRYLNVIAMPEKELCRPGDQHKLLQHKRFSKVGNLIRFRLSKLIIERLRYAFGVWLSKMELLRAALRRRASILIQTVARRWLHRVRNL